MSQSKKPYYNLEFKQNAAQLVISKGYTCPEAATSLGISITALRRWVNAEKNPGHNQDNKASTHLNLSEHAELLGLRKENAKLRMEREILKKASAFFAQEMK
jgi:transposase